MFPALVDVVMGEAVPTAEPIESAETGPYRLADLPVTQLRVIRWFVSHWCMLRSGFATNHGTDESPEATSLGWQLWGAQEAGIPLVLINGLGSPLVSYEEGFLKLLVDAGFTVLRFDNRDVGESSRCESSDASSYNVEDMARDVAAVLDAVGWSHAHVYGQSMGGMIAQQFAISYPERVLSLTSLMSATGEPGLGRPAPQVMDALLKSPPSDRRGWLENRLVTEKLWASAAWWDAEWVQAKGELMFDHGIDPAGAARQFRAIQRSGSRDAALAQLAVATQVIHGTADTLVGIDAGRHTAQVIPGAEFIEIEGMGHDLSPTVWPRLVELLIGLQTRSQLGA